MIKVFRFQPSPTVQLSTAVDMGVRTDLDHAVGMGIRELRVADLATRPLRAAG